MWVAESNFVTGSGIKSHAHSYYHLFMVRSGPVDFTVDDQSYTLNNGETLLAKPGVMHGLNNNSDTLARCYEVKFTASTQVLQRRLDFIPAVLPKNEFATYLVRELVKESTRAELSTPAFVADYLMALLNFYHREYGSQEEAETSVIDVVGYSEVSQKIVQYLEENFDREVPLQEVADVIGLNKNYVCSLFKRDTGMTIGTTMTIIRIRKAAELISFSDMSLQQVAESTGFSNLSHFNRIFKRVVGIPPGQYRRMFTADQLIVDDKMPTEEVLAENGFVVSVLGRNRLTIAEILEQLQETAAGR